MPPVLPRAWLVGHEIHLQKHQLTCLWPLSVKKLKNYCVVDRWAIPVSLLDVGHVAEDWVAFVGVDRPPRPKSCLFDPCLLTFDRAPHCWNGYDYGCGCGCNWDCDLGSDFDYETQKSPWILKKTCSLNDASGDLPIGFLTKSIVFALEKENVAQRMQSEMQQLYVLRHFDGLLGLDRCRLRVIAISFARLAVFQVMRVVAECQICWCCATHYGRVSSIEMSQMLKAIEQGTFVDQVQLYRRRASHEGRNCRDRRSPSSHGSGDPEIETSHLLS